MGNLRDYNSELRNNEGRKYAYNFDFDVLHPFMIKSFEPFLEKKCRLFVRIRLSPWCFY